VALFACFGCLSGALLRQGSAFWCISLNKTVATTIDQGLVQLIILLTQPLFNREWGVMLHTSFYDLG
jgi:hypothetical protein